MRGAIKEQMETTDWRWLAVRDKRREFDGMFYFAVQTTGVFCRPSCSSRTPKEENVSFFETTGEAESAGFRACLRCQPKKNRAPDAGAELIARAFRILQDDEIETATIEELSDRLKVSVGHLQKTFKAILGLSPKEALDWQRLEKFKRQVKARDVTTSLYESGYGSSRSLYEKAGENLGMTPAVYKKGGLNMKIFYTITDSPLGKMMAATTEKGIAAVSFGDDETALENELRKEFPSAEITKDDERLKDSVEAILRGLAGERTLLNLPLDVQASAFQMRVWSELRKIPYGETRSYKQIAEALGNPQSVRAVARACATNPVAIVTPCHRVIGSDGKLSGYRWGIERKAELLREEKESKKVYET